MCLMNPMFSVYLDCPFSLPLRYSLTFICPASCTLCCQFICIVLLHFPFGILQRLFVLSLVYPMLPVFLDCSFSLPFRYSLTFICPVCCIFYVASFSEFYFIINPSIFSNIYFFLCLMNLCCQFFWIVLFHYPFGII